MEIKQANLKWNGKLQTLYLAKVEHIMIHHTAHSTWDIYDVHNYHKTGNGWVGIGYNFFIDTLGQVWEGRGLHIGAGATGYNYNSLHICFAGNFENTNPTKKQIESGKELVKYLLSLCPKNVKIIGHRDIGKTACPGKNFPLDEFKNIMEGNVMEEFKDGQELEALEYLVKHCRIDTDKKQYWSNSIEMIKYQKWIFIEWANDVMKLEK